eukprot:s679_g3.t2
MPAVPGTPGPVAFAPGSPLASPFRGRGPLFSPMLDAGYTRTVASPLQASGAGGTPLSPLVAASYPRSVGGSPIPFCTSSPSGPPRMLTPTSASPLAADRRTASPSQAYDVRRSLSPNLSQTRILQAGVVATKASVSWTDLMQAPVGTRFVVPKGTLHVQEPMAGPDDAEASARPSPLQPAAKQAVDKAAPGNIFSSPKRDAKKLATKKQRELKKLLKADRRENEEIARNLQEATRAKSSRETQAKEAASKLAKAEADLSAEKQSEDALQGALNQLEPKSFFGLF